MTSSYVPPDPTGSADFRLLFELTDSNPYSLCDFKRRPRILFSDMVLNAIQRPCRRFGPTNTHDQASSYLLNIRFISASLANRPSSAALIPSLMRSPCQTCNSRNRSIA